ncbi:hypothetical protein [Clostridium sp.]|uniref:hypothetical protein n=1 Tax=Clostridium sp. TaxID=1506 RepID=UPI00260F2928|nr:hypothetical protein [Clostridium sp.]
MLDLEIAKNYYNNLKEDKNKFNEFALEVIPLLLEELKSTRKEVVELTDRMIYIGGYNK